jgi:hypothetical protein
MKDESEQSATYFLSAGSFDFSNAGFKLACNHFQGLSILK